MRFPWGKAQLVPSTSIKRQPKLAILSAEYLRSLSSKFSFYRFRLVPFRSPLLRESFGLFVTPRPLLIMSDKKSDYVCFFSSRY